MDYAYSSRDGSGSILYRTRGMFNPNSVDNAANSHLPLTENCTVGPELPIIPKDAFVLSSAYTFASLGGLSSVALSIGDMVVYNGGTITAVASWSPVYKNAIYAEVGQIPNMGMRVIGTPNASFLD